MINLTFKLSGQIPSGKNAVIVTRTGQRYPQKRFKAWREEALRVLAREAANQWHVTTPVSMIVDYVPSDHRRRDVPGMADALCHLLEKAGIVSDDCLIQQLSWKTFAPDKGNAGATITILG